MVIIYVFVAIHDCARAKVTHLNLADLSNPVFLFSRHKLGHKLGLVLEYTALVGMRVVVGEESIHRQVIATQFGFEHFLGQFQYLRFAILA